MKQQKNHLFLSILVLRKDFNVWLHMITLCYMVKCNLLNYLTNIFSREFQYVLDIFFLLFLTCKQPLYNSLTISTTGVFLQLLQIKDMQYILHLLLYCSGGYSRCWKKKKKSVISLVHRIKGKKEGKAVCEYKTHLKNLVIQLKTQNHWKKKNKKHILTYQFE